MGIGAGVTTWLKTALKFCCSYVKSGEMCWEQRTITFPSSLVEFFCPKWFSDDPSWIASREVSHALGTLWFKNIIYQEQKGVLSNPAKNKCRRDFGLIFLDPL